MAAPEVILAPSEQDPLARAATTGFGGPLGRFARRAVAPAGWMWPIRILVLMATGMHLLGYLMRMPCRAADFMNRDRYPRLCYSDIPYLYTGRGFDIGAIPYLDHPAGKEALEYPVLTGWFMHLASLLTGGTDEAAKTALRRASEFYDWNAILLGICLIIAVVATALTVRHRPWDAAGFALAPVILTTGLINWDLLAVALLAVSVMLWMRAHPAIAGVFFGLAVSAKFYPVVLIAVLGGLCLRNKKMADFARFMSTALLAWAVVNVPVAIAAPQEWAHFYVFSRTRGVDFGSVWLGLLYTAGVEIPPESLNTVVTATFVVLAAGVMALIFFAPQTPRLAQVAFLMIAAFCLANKVYSPQYVLWMLPFAFLARPRWRDFLIWQAGQVLYAVSVWLFLENSAGDGPRKGFNNLTYGVMTLVTICITVWFCALVVRDILKPQLDIVRTSLRDVGSDAIAASTAAKESAQSQRALVDTDAAALSAATVGRGNGEDMPPADGNAADSPTVRD